MVNFAMQNNLLALVKDIEPDSSQAEIPSEVDEKIHEYLNNYIQERRMIY